MSLPIRARKYDPGLRVVPPAVSHRDGVRYGLPLQNLPMIVIIESKAYAFI